MRTDALRKAMRRLIEWGKGKYPYPSEEWIVRSAEEELNRYEKKLKVRPSVPRERSGAGREP